MGSTSVLTAIRAVTLLFLIIATILVGLSADLCVYYPKHDGTYRCYENGYTLPIAVWPFVPDAWADVKGQYFVFIASLVLMLLTLASLLLAAREGSDNNTARLLGISVAAIGLILCFIFGGLEIWYSVGFGTNYFGAYGGYFKSWVAASAFYFLAAFCYLADLIATVT